MSIISVLPLLGGCPEPRDRFNEFAKLFPDAAPIPDAPSGVLVDISGQFLFGLDVPLARQFRHRVQAIMTVVVNSLAPPMGDITVQFVDKDTRLLTGDPVTYSDIPINTDGTFTINVGTLTIVAPATDLGQVVAENVVIMGRIISADFVCGDVTGMVTMPAALPLAGSTFGAQKIPDGTIGANLPDPILNCGGGSSPIDAGTSTPDAP